MNPPIDLIKLRELCEKAIKDVEEDLANGLPMHEIAQIFSFADLYTDCTPSTVLSLLDEVERLRGDCETLRLTMAGSSKCLDGIKYDLEASVYTLEDDEFEKVFFVRDTIDEILTRITTPGALDEGKDR